MKLIGDQAPIGYRATISGITGGTKKKKAVKKRTIKRKPAKKKVKKKSAKKKKKR